jgi:hypothetical protein
MTNWRSDVRDNAVLTCSAFLTANSGLADRVYRARPESLAETTAIFVGTITEDIRLDAGTWQRVVDVEIVTTRHLADNAETTDDLEELADTLIDWLAANDRAHAFGDNTEQHPIRSATTEIQEGTVFVPAILITCRATIQQGRS